jgi:hypothetical protein
MMVIDDELHLHDSLRELPMRLSAPRVWPA